MRSTAKAVERLRRMPRLTKLLAESRGLINTTDLLVATAATVILAAGVGSAAISTMNDAKYGKAQPDAQAMGNAITQFFKDTGKWPGQAEQAGATPTATGGSTVPAQFLVTAGEGTADVDLALRPINFATTTGTGSTAVTSTAISVLEAACRNNSLEGFVGKSIAAGALADATLRNINDYLVHKPDPLKYQNWKGPYLQEEIKTDPWDRVWVFNLQPLYCSETVTGGTSGVSASVTSGNLGYAWALSGGSNRTVTTRLLSTHLDPTGDDTGISLGKLITRGTGGADAGTTP